MSKSSGSIRRRSAFFWAHTAHVDHIGGFARVKKKTGATIYLSPADAELAGRGGKGDIHFGDSMPYPPVTADRPVANGDTIQLGRIALHALLTPGHTPGCTTWRTTVVEKKKPLDVVILCSVSAPGYQLVNNEKYPSILDDYRATFRTLRTLHPDIFLANHGQFFDLAAKLKKREAGSRNPFIVPGELEAFLDRAAKGIEEQASAQQK